MSINPLIPFMGPIGPLGTPIVSVGGSPPPFGSIGPNTPMPLVPGASPLNPSGSRQLIGGPFGSPPTFHAGFPTAAGGFVIINNFSINSVSNFARLGKTGDSSGTVFENLRKELGSPNCVINKRNGVAVWVTDNFRFTLNDTDDTDGVIDGSAGGELAGPGTGTNVKGLVTLTVTVTSAGATGAGNLGALEGIAHNEPHELHISADSATHALAFLVVEFAPLPTGVADKPDFMKIAWANDYSKNMDLLKSVIGTNFV